MIRPINVGLLGIGTVGGGTWDVLGRNAGEIRRRAGRAIRITQVADKDLKKAKRLTAGKAKILSDAFQVVRAKDVDIVVELIGGTRIARDLVLEAIANGKHGVTVGVPIAIYRNRFKSVWDLQRDGHGDAARWAALETDHFRSCRISSACSSGRTFA